jgi:hypothetical protein
MNDRSYLRIPLLALTAILTLALTGCGDDNPTAPGQPDDPGQATDPVILVLGDGGTETHVTATLTAAGLDVRDGGLFHEFDGSGLDGVDAVVLLTGIEYSNDMQDAGEAALVTFVLEGGGLVTTEWLNYSIERQGFHQILQSVLPVAYGGSYGSGSETYTVMADHPVTDGLPATFTTGNDSDYAVVSPKSGAEQLVRGSRSGHAVVTWAPGGRVVSWNMTGEYGGQDVWNAEMDRLLVNATRYAAGWGDDGGEATETTLFKFQAVDLQITHDGDGAPGSGSAGDFYITVRLIDVSGSEDIELDRRNEVLVQGHDGDQIGLDIATDAELPAVEGQRIKASVSYFENDPGGRQATAGISMVYAYDPATDCWINEGSGACISATSSELGWLFLESNVPDPLEAALMWRFEQQ